MGFCLKHEQFQNLKDGEYEVFIDTELFNGELNYGELLIKGESEKEVFLVLMFAILQWPITSFRDPQL